MKEYTLVLGGGASKGFSHIGVLEGLLEQGVKPSAIVSSSMGSIIGAFYAYYGGIEKGKEIALKFKASLLANLNIGFLFSNYYLTSTKIEKTLNDFWGKDTNIEDLSIPFYPVVTDLAIGKAVALKSGNLTKSVLASCCVPCIFKPVCIDGRYYVDGGLLDNVPSKIAKECFDRPVIAVDAVNELTIDKVPKTKTKMFFRMLMLQMVEMSREKHHYADIVIKPKVDEFSEFEYAPQKTATMIERGRQAVEENMDKIRKILK